MRNCHVTLKGNLQRSKDPAKHTPDFLEKFLDWGTWRSGLNGREVVEARSPLLGAGISVKPLRGDRSIPDAPAMLELSEERRAKLIAFIEGNKRMPAEAKARVLARLAEPQVPARMVERIEGRMGG